MPPSSASWTTWTLASSHSVDEVRRFWGVPTVLAQATALEDRAFGVLKLACASWCGGLLPRPASRPGLSVGLQFLNYSKIEVATSCGIFIAEARETSRLTPVSYKLRDLPRRPSGPRKNTCRAGAPIPSDG